MKRTLTVFGHLMQTYQQAEREHPEIMEPFAQSIEDAEDREAQARAMRHALAMTICQRYPLPEVREVVAVDDRQGALPL